MKRKDVIRMAKEAGATLYADTVCINEKDADEFIERFAALVAAAERERVAKAFDEIAGNAWSKEEVKIAERCAAHVRSLGDE